MISQYYVNARHADSLTVPSQAPFSSFLWFLYKAQLVLDLTTTPKLSLQQYISTSGSPSGSREKETPSLVSWRTIPPTTIFKRNLQRFKHPRFTQNKNIQSQNAGLNKFNKLANKPLLVHIYTEKEQAAQFWRMCPHSWGSKMGSCSIKENLKFTS